MGLRKKHPELKRSYKAPLIMVGAPVSALIYLYMMTELSNEAFTPALYGVSSELLFTGAALSITEPAHLLSWMKSFRC